MKFNKKLFLIIVLIAMSIGLIFMFTETISPRNDIVQVSLEKSDFIQITKTEKNNNYYISFKKDNKQMEITCTKEQYDFMINGRPLYILYRKNFFNRTKGKVLKVDNIPIDNSNRGI